MNWFCCEISHCYPDVFQILGSLICRHLHVVNVLGLILKLLWSVLLSTHQPNGIVCKHLNNHCISHQLILALYKFIGVCHICQIHIGITFVYQMVHQDLLLQWRNGFQCSWWWVLKLLWSCENAEMAETKKYKCVVFFMLMLVILESLVYLIHVCWHVTVPSVGKRFAVFVSNLWLIQCSVLIWDFLNKNTVLLNMFLWVKYVFLADFMFMAGILALLD